MQETKSSVVSRSCTLDKDRRISATILWYVNGVPLVPDLYRTLLDDNQTLQFNPLRSLTDQGVFMCRVYTDAGNATKAYNITVIEVPLSVNPTAELSSIPRAITVSWRAPFDGNTPITKYILRSRENSACKFVFILLIHELHELKTSHTWCQNRPIFYDFH